MTTRITGNPRLLAVEEPDLEAENLEIESLIASSIESIYGQTERNIRETVAPTVSANYIERELAAQTIVIKDFIQRYEETMEKITEGLKALNLAPLNEDEFELMADVWGGLDSLKNDIEEMKTVSSKISNGELEKAAVPVKDFTKLVHDIGGRLTCVAYNLQYLLEYKNLTAQEYAELEKIHVLSGVLVKWLHVLRGAYRGGETVTTWQMTGFGEEAEKETAKLDVPKHSAICLIEDSKEITAVWERLTGESGIRLHAADDEDSLVEELGVIQSHFGQHVTPLFLLDHDLGKRKSGLYGHHLLTTIRAKIPGAKIAVHTSDPGAIREVDYPGVVEVLDKLDIEGINRLAQSMFKIKS